MIVTPEFGIWLIKCPDGLENDAAIMDEAIRETKRCYPHREATHNSGLAGRGQSGD